MVEEAITNPTSAVHKEMTAWKDLSPLVSECLQSHVNFCLPRNTGRTYLETTNATSVVNIQGGTQSRRVTVRLYPSVAVRVGKNVPNEREVTIQAALQIVNKLNEIRKYKG